MAKNMARLQGNIVVNVESWSDNARETDTLKYLKDHYIRIGDIYNNGRWFREGIEVLTYTEELEIKNEDMRNALSLLLGDE